MSITFWLVVWTGYVDGIYAEHRQIVDSLEAADQLFDELSLDPDISICEGSLFPQL